MSDNLLEFLKNKFVETNPTVEYPDIPPEAQARTSKRSPRVKAEEAPPVPVVDEESVPTIDQNNNNQFEATVEVHHEEPFFSAPTEADPGAVAAREDLMTQLKSTLNETGFIDKIKHAAVLRASEQTKADEEDEEKEKVEDNEADDNETCESSADNIKPAEVNNTPQDGSIVINNNPPEPSAGDSVFVGPKIDGQEAQPSPHEEDKKEEEAKQDIVAEVLEEPKVEPAQPAENNATQPLEVEQQQQVNNNAEKDATKVIASSDETINSPPPSSSPSEASSASAASPRSSLPRSVSSIEVSTKFNSLPRKPANGHPGFMRATSTKANFRIESIKEEQKVTHSHVQQMKEFWKGQIIRTAPESK